MAFSPNIIFDFDRKVCIPTHRKSAFEWQLYESSFRQNVIKMRHREVSHISFSGHLKCILQDNFGRFIGRQSRLVSKAYRSSWGRKAPEEIILTGMISAAASTGPLKRLNYSIISICYTKIFRQSSSILRLREPMDEGRIVIQVLRSQKIEKGKV